MCIYYFKYYIPEHNKKNKYETKILDLHRQFQNWKATGELHITFGEPDKAITHFKKASDLAYQIRQLIDKQQLNTNLN